MTRIVDLADRRAGSPAALDWHDAVRAALLRARTPAGHWEGRLSTSALSTATAVIALASASRHDSGVVAHIDSGVEIADSAYVERGAAWLSAHANADGSERVASSGGTSRAHDRSTSASL